MDAKDDKRLSLTQRRSQVRVLFRPPFYPHPLGVLLNYAYKWGCGDLGIGSGEISCATVCNGIGVTSSSIFSAASTCMLGISCPYTSKVIEPWRGPTVCIQRSLEYHCSTSRMLLCDADHESGSQTSQLSIKSQASIR